MKNNANGYMAVAAVALLLGGLLLTTGEAAPNPRVAAELAVKQEAIAALTQQLESKEAGVQDKAIEGIRQLIQDDPLLPTQVALSGWLKTLLADKRYDAVEDLARRCLVARPELPRYAEEFAKARVTALRALGKKAEALAAAKTLYNISLMQGTSAALQEISDCLEAMDDGGKEKAAAFKREQLAAATVDPAAKGVPARSAVMDSIKVDAKDYEDSLALFTGDDYETLVIRGDLLLLADRGKEARAVFEQAYAEVKDAKVGQATENIARAIKAQDGTIGRANAWVLSVRPHEGGEPAKAAER